MANIPNEEIQSREIVPFQDMDFISKETKRTSDYNRSIAKSVYSYYVNNKTEFSWDYGTRIDELRLIGQGRQSVDYYKRYFSYAENAQQNNVVGEVETYFANSADANRYGWMNVIWDNLSPIANVKTVAKSIIKKTDADIMANIIDIAATEDEDRRMMKSYTEAKNRQLFEFLHKKWNIPSTGSQVITDEYTDLVEIKKQGGFKAHYILALEQILLWTEKYSEWDDHLKERFFDDLFDTRYAFACVKYEPLTYKPKWQWVDVRDVVVQTSLRHDFSDSQYWGYFDYPTVNELRGVSDRMTDGKKTGLNKDDWNELGKQYADYMGNPTRAEWNKIEVEEKGFSGKAGSVHVCRLNLYWKDYEQEDKIEYTTKHGKKKRRKKKDGEKVAPGDKIVSSRTEVTYGVSWIVGTDWIYDYGPMVNMPRKNLRECYLPFAGVKLMEKSYTERLAPLAHMFAIAWVRLCNSIAKAQNDFYYIDINALAELEMGNKKLPWDEILTMMREENVLFGDSSRQAPTLGGTGVPVQRIQGTAAEDMMKEMALMDQTYAKIEQMIGLPPVAMGVTPQTDQAVRTTQMSVSSSNTALDLLINAVLLGKKRLGELSASMWQNALKYNDEAKKEAARVIGSEDVQAIIEARTTFQEIGIDLSPRPTEELKQKFLRIAELEVGRKNQGQAGITSEQYMRLEYHFETGGAFLEALSRLSYWIKQDQKRLEAEKQAAIQQQGATLDQNARTAAEEERKTQMMKSEQDRRDAENEALQKNIEEDNRFRNKIKELLVEHNLEQNESPLRGLADLEKQLQTPVS